MDEFKRKMAIRYGIKSLINVLIAGAITVIFMLLHDYIISSPFALSWKFIRTAELVLIILGAIFWIRAFHFMRKYIDYGN